jgi:hypothetical protein
MFETPDIKATSVVLRGKKVVFLLKIGFQTLHLFPQSLSQRESLPLSFEPMAGRPSTVEKYIRENSQLSPQKKNVGFQDRLDYRRFGIRLSEI